MLADRQSSAHAAIQYIKPSVGLFAAPNSLTNSLPDSTE